MAAAPQKAPEHKPVPFAMQPVTEGHNHLPGQNFALAEVKITNWSATIPRGHTMDDVTDPEYWTHVAGTLRMCAHIHCYWEDNSAYAELLVVGRTNTSARVIAIRHVDIRAETATIDFAAELSAFEISYAGPANGFRVVRKSTNETVKENLMDENTAKRWLVDFVAGPKKAA